MYMVSNDRYLYTQAYMCKGLHPHSVGLQQKENLIRIIPFCSPPRGQILSLYYLSLCVYL